MATFIPCKQCPGQDCGVFDRVVISHLITGGTRVMWELLPTFTDPNPLVFQLQVGTTANPDADDWQDVGIPMENVYFATDPEQRVWGKTNWTYYRVMVTSSRGNYLSLPTGATGTLSRRDHLKARNLARRKLTTFRLGEGQEGFLLKRRISGQKCRVCTDTVTQEVRDPDCPSCYGTGRECGYYYPMACVWANMSPKARRIQLDGDSGGQRGTVSDIVVQAQMLMTDLLLEDDVWVNKVSDDRYYVHRVDHTAEIRGVPVLASVEMRPIPFTSAIYTIAIPEQLAALGLA